MILKPLEDSEIREVMEDELRKALEQGLPCLMGVGLNGAQTDAINDVARAYPNATPAQAQAVKDLMPQ